MMMPGRPAKILLVDSNVYFSKRLGDALKREGFEVVGARQSVTRVPGKSDFTKHLLRLRRMDNLEAYKVGDTVAEMLLKNANDGTSVYDLFAGPQFGIGQLFLAAVLKYGYEDSVEERHT